MTTADAPLTKTDLLEAIKELPTKDEVREIVKSETREIVQDELTEYTSDHTDPQHEALKNGLEELRRGQGKIKTDLQFIKNDIADLKVDTVPKKEVDDLKKKVELHHPTN